MSRTPCSSDDLEENPLQVPLAVAGDVFGPVDPYGIGLPKDSDGVAFVNAFLQTIIADGTWAQLWQISLGNRTGIDTAPEAPVIGE